MEVGRCSLYLATPTVLVLIELTISGQCPLVLEPVNMRNMLVVNGLGN